jgi:hypothetical protein
VNQNTTFNSNQQNETQYINYCINNTLLQLNTFLPAKIISVDGETAIIQTMLMSKGLNQSSPNPVQITGVPLGQISGGNAGVIIEYKPNDVVLCGAIQRDISSMKNGWRAGVAPSNRKFNLSDVVVICKLSNTSPISYVKITEELIEIKGTTQPIKINTAGNVEITSSAEIKLTAPQINITGTLSINGTPFPAHIHSGGTISGNTGGVV